MNKIKTILRANDMPKWANWVANNKIDGICFYRIKPKKFNGIVFQSNEPYKKNATAEIVNYKPYCKNHKKSLRKIVDSKKPKRKDLHKEIAILNKIISNHISSAWVCYDFRSD